jgi:hypothetical protein
MKWRGITQRDKPTSGQTSRLLIFSLSMAFLLADSGFKVFGKSTSLDLDSSLETDHPPIFPEPARATRPTVNQDNPSMRGNPLWQIPLSSLTATRERPVFSTSRRPPAPPAVATAYVPPPPPKPAPAPEPDHPLLTLLGTITGDTHEIGIFVEDATGNILRLKTGQDFSGWILRSIRGRNAEFKKADRTATLELPARSVFQPAPPLRFPITPVSNTSWKGGDEPIIATSPQQTYLPSGQAAGGDPWMGPMGRSGKNTKGPK